MNTIAYVEDHVIVRESIARIIDRFEGFQVISQASDGEELIQCFAQSGIPDILLLELNMRGMGGYETAVWVKKNHPQVKIMVLSMFDAPHQMVRMLTVGVQAFISKNIDFGELQKALRHVAAYETVYKGGNNGELDKILRHIGKPAVLDKILLTDWELEFVQLACGEHSYREIGQIMFVSERTISNIRNSVYAKLQVRNRVGLAISAARNGIIRCLDRPIHC